MAKNRGYKTPNEKFDEEFADLSSNPVKQKVQSSQSSAKSTGYKTPNEKFDEEFADLSNNPVQQKVQEAKSKKQTR